MSDESGVVVVHQRFPWLENEEDRFMTTSYNISEKAEAKYLQTLLNIYRKSNEPRRVSDY